MYINRNRVAVRGVDCRAAVPRPFSILPYGCVRRFATQSSEKKFLAELKEGEVAYLWPAASLRTHEILRQRGNPIILEGINTRMARARETLDRAYLAAGLEPRHGITDERIAEEEEKLGLARAIFAPSPGVEAGVQNSNLPADGVISTSYGARLEGRQRVVLRRNRKLTFLFVGAVCIRKGAHQLLRAWSEAKVEGTLVLAGPIEPAVTAICSTELNRPDVQCMGFVRNIDKLYWNADIFVLPSFEEGDPLATYEAAAFGLPIIASPMGAGRIGADKGCALLVDPASPPTIAVALRQMSESAEVRSEWGSRAASAVKSYSWAQVGATRVARLAALLNGSCK
jgi:glycosyltransferase involved in cell wall biosynthesis